MAVLGLQLAGAAAAVAQGPSLSPVSVASVTSGSALLEGGVRPNGFRSTYYFQYGGSEDFSSTLDSPHRETTTTFAETPVHIELMGLLRDKVYYFRLVASNQAGTTVGSFAEGTAGSFQTEPGLCEEAACQAPSFVEDVTLATLSPGLGNPPPSYVTYCRKGFVRKHGHCAPRRHHRKRRHRRNAAR